MARSELASGLASGLLLAPIAIGSALMSGLGSTAFEEIGLSAFWIGAGLITCSLLGLAIRFHAPRGRLQDPAQAIIE